ncbi:hypothetical protein Tco_1438094 [Tanacetum coccineum]
MAIQGGRVQKYKPQGKAKGKGKVELMKNKKKTGGQNVASTSSGDLEAAMKLKRRMSILGLWANGVVCARKWKLLEVLTSGVVRSYEKVTADILQSKIWDLNEPANYKAALSDLKFDKWLVAMNAEMKSMYDNKLWRLVVLPPNTKVVKSKWIYKKKTDMDGKDYLSYSCNSFGDYGGFGKWIMSLMLSDVGSIMYDDGCTRPDVTFAQNITSRFQQNSGEAHCIAVKNILKYLRNTKDTFLVYGGNPEAELRVNCYWNAGFETNRDDTKSQTGYVFVLNGGAVVWKSSKQSTIAQHATEAEYIAASEAAKEAVWIRKFIDE